MQWLHLLFRIIVFAGGLFFLMEYIVACKVDTKTGVILLLASTTIAAGVFVMFRMHNIRVCPTCHSVESLSGNFRV